jgi:hypothetical protein
MDAEVKFFVNAMKCLPDAAPRLARKWSSSLVPWDGQAMEIAAYASVPSLHWPLYVNEPASK